MHGQNHIKFVFVCWHGGNFTFAVKI